jgi:hypothetical protein
MQDRYVPDLGDFSKLAVLREIARPGRADGFKIGVVWYLTLPEVRRDGSLRNNDGRHRAYLRSGDWNARTFRSCEPELYDVLQQIEISGAHCVGEYKKRRVLGEGEHCVYVEEPVAVSGHSRREREAQRWAWFQRVLSAVAETELVFVDPDNGLLPAGISIGDLSARKYVSLGECAALYEQGRRTIVVYQHAHRQASAIEQALSHLCSLRSRLARVGDMFALRFHRGSSRFYLVVAAPEHSAVLRERAVAMVRGPWGKLGHFSLITLEQDLGRSGRRSIVSR